MNYILVIMICVLSVFSSAQAQETSDLQKRSQQLASQLGKSLKVKLAMAMNTGDYAKAIKVCSTEAPKIASRLSAVSGARIQRVSMQYRNPLNMPAAWQRDVLVQFDTQVNGADYYQDDGINPVRYMKAIRVQGLCMACHGHKLPDAVSRSLADLYPLDKAVGYGVGDLRGAFSVEWPVEYSQAKSHMLRQHEAKE